MVKNNKAKKDRRGKNKGGSNPVTSTPLLYIVPFELLSWDRIILN